MGKKSRKLRSPKYAKKAAIFRNRVEALRARADVTLETSPQAEPSPAIPTVDHPVVVETTTTTEAVTTVEAVEISPATEKVEKVPLPEEKVIQVEEPVVLTTPAVKKEPLTHTKAKPKATRKRSTRKPATNK
jgi:hypothetical protein